MFKSPWNVQTLDYYYSSYLDTIWADGSATFSFWRYNMPLSIGIKFQLFIDIDVYNIIFFSLPHDILEQYKQKGISVLLFHSTIMSSRFSRIFKDALDIHYLEQYKSLHSCTILNHVQYSSLLSLPHFIYTLHNSAFGSFYFYVSDQALYFENSMKWFYCQK